jgi:hypothetical protein
MLKMQVLILIWGIKIMEWDLVNHKCIIKDKVINLKIKKLRIAMKKMIDMIIKRIIRSKESLVVNMKMMILVLI